MFCFQTVLQNKSSIAVHMLQAHEALKELLMKKHSAVSLNSEKMALHVFTTG